MSTPVEIHITVLVDSPLHDIYVEQLKGRRGGGDREVRDECERLLNDADENRYDAGEMAGLLMARAGATDLRMGLGTCEVPVQAADWDIDA